MADLVWLDLCSGLGGASQPAVDRGWKVIRVDIDPRFKPDIVADVRALPFTNAVDRYECPMACNCGADWHERRLIPEIDVLWASPPCKDFAKHQLRCFFPNPPEPDLSIALGIKRAIAQLRPQFWVVENVWAARPWLAKIFGQVRAKPPGHALWSNLAFLLPNLQPHKGGMGYWGPGRWGPTGTSGAGADEGAKIPYEIGEAICRAVEARNA